MTSDNLFQHIPADLPDELSESLLSSKSLRIERIVSRGHQTAAGQWYDQPEGEWVLLVSGEAKLRFRESGEIVHLIPGSYLDIPAHLQHRVEWTSDSMDTIWLVVFHP